jgi:hypothetical protein
MRDSRVLSYVCARQAGAGILLWVRAAAISVVAFSLSDVALKLYCRNASIDFGYDGSKPAATTREAVARYFQGPAARVFGAARYCALGAVIMLLTFNFSNIVRKRLFIAWRTTLLACGSLAISFLIQPRLWIALHHSI